MAVAISSLVVMAAMMRGRQYGNVCRSPHGNDGLRAGDHPHHPLPLPLGRRHVALPAPSAAPTAVLRLDVGHLPPLLRVSAHGDAAVGALAVVDQAEIMKRSINSRGE